MAYTQNEIIFYNSALEELLTCLVKDEILSSWEYGWSLSFDKDLKPDGLNVYIIFRKLDDVKIIGEGKHQMIFPTDDIDDFKDKIKNYLYENDLDVPIMIDYVKSFKKRNNYYSHYIIAIKPN